MECLFISIVAMALNLFDVISIDLCMTIIIASIAFTWIAACLYFTFGFMKSYYHGLLGWHMPDYDYSHEWFDGCSLHARCKHCGKSIMQDSQGNWFTFE